MTRSVIPLVLLLGCGSDSPPRDAGADAGPPPADSGVRDAAPPEDTGTDAPLDAGPPVAGDDCSRAIDIAAVAMPQPDGTLILSTSNAGAHVDMEVCDALAGPGIPTSDLVYRFDAPVAGRLHWELDPGKPPALFTVDLRTTCDDPTSNFYCDECPLRCVRTRDLAAGESLFFVVTTILTAGGPEPGTFELRLRHVPFLGDGDPCVASPGPDEPECGAGLVCQERDGEPPVCGALVCGDGFLGFGTETCDDGNTSDGDGCSSSCEPDEQPAGGATCAEATTLAFPRVRLLPAADALLYATASGDVMAGSDATASCAATTGPEAFYAIDVPTPSRLELSASGVESISVLSSCTGPDLGCAIATPPTAVVLTLDRVEPGRYFVVLDRTDPTAATGSGYSAEALLTPL